MYPNMVFLHLVIDFVKILITKTAHIDTVFQYFCDVTSQLLQLMQQLSWHSFDLSLAHMNERREGLLDTLVDEEKCS